MSTVNDAFIYECFSEVYYNHVYRNYTDTQVSVYDTCQCLLKSFFARKMPRRLMDNKIVVLSFGNLVHEALRVPLEKRGFKSEKEGVLDLKGIELFAHGDAVRDDCGIDHKTITRMPHAPLIHHYYQCNAYMHVFDKKQWFLNYVHKPSGICKVFPLEPSIHGFQVSTLRAIRLSKCLQTNVMPQPEPSWLCRFCEWYDICPIYRKPSTFKVVT